MFGLGVIGAAGRSATGGVFDADDLANGTLVLNFVDRPAQTLAMDFTTGGYSQWATDSTASLPSLVGYYQVKG